METSLSEVVSLIKGIYKPENLGVVLLTKEILSNADIQAFIREALEKQLGDLTDVEQMPDKPVRLIPILNLQWDVDKLKERGEDSILAGKDIMHYLLQLNIYLNDACTANCIHCRDYCQQTLCCTATCGNHTELSVNDIENLFRQIQYATIGKINLLGGNIFQYRNMTSMRKFFDSFEGLVHGYFHYGNYASDILPDSIIPNIIVSFPIKDTLLEEIWNKIDRKKATVHFLIENEDQYAQAEQSISHLEMENYSIHPFYTGENLDFFSENILLNRDDIFSTPLQMREIFRNQKLNSFFFGLLYVMPDGSVKANMNTSVIGNIKTDSILNLIHKELIDNTAWRKIRDAEPCCNCLYQWLCPAPSNYERVIGRPNLCHVK
jgi:pseudo-rSAM protein